MGYQNILFDLDGTISNSKEGITKCIQYALAKHGIEENNPDALEHFIGPPLTQEFMRSYGFSQEEAEIATEEYRERYEPIGLYEASMYPGVSRLLEHLKKDGKTIALATSKPQKMAEEVLRFFQIDIYFDYIMGADRNGPRQSKTDVLLALFEAMNISETEKKQTVLIGDTSFDVEGANDVGIDCIGVEYGFGSVQEMLEKGAKTIVKDSEELKQIL